MTQELFPDRMPTSAKRPRPWWRGEQGIVLEPHVFYPLGGGQAATPACSCWRTETRCAIADTRKARTADGKTTADITHGPGRWPGRVLARLRLVTR
jgi:misacylated tRNA(Ala) deacylase